MGDIRDRLDVRAQIATAQRELAQLERQDERLGRLVQQAEALRDAIGQELGKLSHEFMQARTTFLFVADARGDCMASIVRMRLHIDRLNEALQ